MDRFVRWAETGKNSRTAGCFDIGGTVDSALRRYADTGDPKAVSTDERSTGNGSLMWLAQVPIRWHANPTFCADVARRQSRTTHGAVGAVEACAAFAVLFSVTINGLRRAELNRVAFKSSDTKVNAILGAPWTYKSPNEIRSTGYVIETLEAASRSVRNADNFEKAALLAANLGDDADSVAAVTGQLAGVIRGAFGIAPERRKKLAWRDHMVGWRRRSTI